MSKGNRKRRQELGLLPSAGKCAARRRDGSPCGMAPVRGAAVCRMHGGSAPQVVAKAKERLALAADDAVSVLIRLMTDPNVSPADRRQAATAVLDRAGIRSGAELEIVVAPWQMAIEGMVAEVGDDAAMTRRHADAYAKRSEPRPVLTDQASTPVIEGTVVAEWTGGPQTPVSAPDPAPRQGSRTARIEP